MTDVTEILSKIEHGDPTAADKLLPLVYQELRKLAAAKLAQERPGQTLQATALLHEAYLRLVGSDPVRQWNSRGHFFAAAAEAMRRILLENSRRKGRKKRDARIVHGDLDQIAVSTAIDLVALDEALTKLASHAPRKAELVKLKYFGGFSLREVADLLQISYATAKRDWVYARAWLLAEMSE